MGNDISDKHQYGSANVVGLDIHSVRMIVSLARQLCSGNHKVQEEREGQEIHGDELH
jgi:hypothetical protein